MTSASPQKLAVDGSLPPCPSIRIYRHLPPRPPREPRSFLWHVSCVLAKLSLMVVVACAFLLIPHPGLRAFKRLGDMLPDPVGDPDTVRNTESRVKKDLDALAPTSGSKPRQTFGMGSNKETVLAVQGRPTSASVGIWLYGASEVYFVGDHVAGWHDSPSDPLMLR